MMMVNSTVFRMRVLLEFFSAKSVNSIVFRIRILLVTEIFLCEVYRFQKTSQTSDAQKNTPYESMLSKVYRSSSSKFPSVYHSSLRIFCGCDFLWFIGFLFGNYVY